MASILAAPGSTASGDRLARTRLGHVHLALLVPVALAGCAELLDIQDPQTSAADAQADAQRVPTPRHRYALTAGLADELGGPSLSGLGGVRDASGYRFKMYDGLTLTGGVPAQAYTIDLRFSLDRIAMYQKLIDFKGLSADEGLYVYGASIDFVVNAAQPVEIETPALIVAGQAIQLTLTRTAAGLVTAYVDGAHPVAFDDGASAAAAFSQPGQVAYFFVDDTLSRPDENAVGTVQQISIWDAPLTAEQVAALRD